MSEFSLRKIQTTILINPTQLFPAGHFRGCKTNNLSPFIPIKAHPKNYLKMGKDKKHCFAV
jgi:hypothetical protein